MDTEPGQPRRRGRRIRARAGIDPSLLKRMRIMGLVTGIFEKEVLLLLYYLVFSYIAGAFPEATIQALFFIAGTALQIWLKVLGRAMPWNHFILFLAYLVGTLVNLGRNTLGNGLLVFLLVVSCVSALYERYRTRLKRPILASLLG